MTLWNKLVVCMSTNVGCIKFNVLKTSLFGSLQTNHPGCVYPLICWDAVLHLHSEPGAPLGGVHHRWSSRVGDPSLYCE